MSFLTDFRPSTGGVAYPSSDTSPQSVSGAVNVNLVQTNKQIFQLTGDTTFSLTGGSSNTDHIGYIEILNPYDYAVTFSTGFNADATVLEAFHPRYWEFTGRTYDASGVVTNNWGVSFKDDLTKMYLVDDGTIRQFSITDGDLSTISDDMVTGTINTPTSNIIWADGGTRIYVIDTLDRVEHYTLSTAWDLSTISFVGEHSISTEMSTGQALAIKPDGTKLYAIGNDVGNGDQFIRYSFGTAFDESTLSIDFSFPLGDARGDGVQEIALFDNGAAIIVAAQELHNAQVLQLNTQGSPVLSAGGADILTHLPGCSSDDLRQVVPLNNGKVIVRGGAGVNVLYEFTAPTGNGYLFHQLGTTAYLEKTYPV